ncbi:MAG: hypothetical protein A4E57_02063 [Syntrophorhabdaceae bacterium PtaU1.Bin034]|nr:MAG: hypothetical protein A4E57_02063 [Syntrophorhabdaceae bacterium PtaU1.Bin034]
MDPFKETGLNLEGGFRREARGTASRGPDKPGRNFLCPGIEGMSGMITPNLTFDTS